MKTRLLYLFLILAIYSCSNSEATQFVLFDQEFTFTYQDAISSSPSKSHYYITNEKLSPTVPKDWTHPVDF
ncbi:hypothetical protein [Kordia sp.]|uniref:hypothetical protein n=1 Tax=Kordia sp. TaxID=1965332 RepID=UPI0025C31A83|nr:hypothetical protein [Kordia sp.]MCH2196360.1 lytic polysaccharide monooxygenase [Kordia sp.]